MQGPSVVAQGTADRFNRLPERPVQAVVVDEDDDARDEVRDGRAVAAVVIDLPRPTTSSTSPPSTTPR